MNGLLSFLLDIVTQPAVLVSLISILGSVLQKNSLSQTITSGIKTFVGFLILQAGAGVIENSLAPFSEMFQYAFNTQGLVPNNEAVVGVALNEFGTNTALIMMVGMITNVIIARITKYKYIYLSGHVMLYMACLIAIILQQFNMTNMMIVAVGGLALGLYNTIFPAFLQPFTRKVTGTDDIAVAHTGNFGYLISALIGKYVGDKEKSTEDISFPKGLSFLRDSTVSVALTMIISYIIVALFAGNEWVSENLSNGTNYIVFSIIEGGKFSGGVYVILAGVRMLLQEIVPAFQGISEKVVPGAIPALDVPTVFPFAQNAVLIGFISSFLGGIISMVIQGSFGLPIVIPGVIAHFMCGATSGVFGNATGGRRGAVLGAFIQGILISFVPIILMPLMGQLGFSGSTFADADYSVVGIFLGGLSQIGGQNAIIGGIVAVLVIVLLMSYFSGKKEISESK
ncbi:PTS ascorbate transporter subunit IIC [Aerococcus urinaeequi]|uniref:Ascorbate-specific PTS system EIIC component n=1 Tax=Aerococcus urinaeequi TaxID=51665 RepID=A0AA47G9M4_9LACT|nr:PTS ascorbate transporter subunit IIC [Aerococcus urinaeequi]WAT24885.1 PTS ascorbate transporter subunit IIC [Aerococcus urinaeequi]